MTDIIITFRIRVQELEMDDHALRVLFVASEAVPFVKVGGLGDFAASLPKALRRLGVDVRLMIPRYGHIHNKDYDFRRVGEVVHVPLGPDQEQVHLLEATVEDVPVYMIWDEKYFFARERVYGFNDDPQRFTFFSRAVIAALPLLQWQPQLIHANDWHVAPMVTWLNFYGRHEPFYRDMAALYTIHNLAYQGTCGRLILTFAQMEKVPHLSAESPGQVNWMAQGIANADLINTVSPTYAQEVLKPEMGLGMDELLTERQDRFFGILSGIDVERWNPKHDDVLTQPFDLNSLPLRRVNKTALQREINLPAQAELPLVGMIARLDCMKGLDILLPALEVLLEERALQFVILGTGEPEYEAQLRALQERFPDLVRVLIKFDDRLARRIYAGVDLLVGPSFLEPGGLSHMIGMHYGAVPVVRATGALADTVVDVEANPLRGTGFVFSDYTAEALEAALRRAFTVYRDAAAWSAIQKCAMERDFSWESSARAYLDLYTRALSLH